MPTSTPVPAARETRTTDSADELVGLLRDFSVGFTAVFDEALGTSYLGNTGIRAVLSLGVGGTTTSELSKDSGLDRRATARLVAHLRDQGTVTVCDEPTDRRRQRVQLTRNGRRTLRRLESGVAAYFVEAAPIASRVVDLVGVWIPEAAGSEVPGPLEVADRIAKVGIALREAFVRTSHGEPVGGRRLLALHLLSSGPAPVRPAALAEGLHLSSGGTTYLLEQMERERLVSRRYGVPGDRRAVEVVLTHQGQEAVQSLRSSVASVRPELSRVFVDVLKQRDRPERSPRAHVMRASNPWSG